MSILLTLCTTVLILTSLLLILLVLAQKAKSDGGMGAAMGGGMAEATFGADTGNVLSGLTIKAAVVFFVLSISLYLGRIYESKHSAASSGLLPTIAVPASVKTTKAPAGIAMPANAAPAPTPAAKP
jgi:preprotein translocase subunit SecG